MAPSPIPLLGIITIFFVAEGLIFGDELLEESFPDSPDEPDGIFDVLLQIVQAIWGVLVLVWNAATANVPGAPWWVRVPVGVFVGGGLIWSAAALARGGS